MSIKKPTLGRGLDALLSSALKSEPSKKEKKAEETLDQAGLTELKIDSLFPGKYQPRQEIKKPELESLSQSIKTQGIIQPILVRKISNNRYEIIAGERRWRAAQLAGLKTVPVIVKEIPDKDAIVMALIENIQREDLNPLEEAYALERLAKEFNLTHAEVADKIGKSRTAVTNLLRILNLTDEVKSLLEKGEIELGHAKLLLTLSSSEQISIAKLISVRGLSVRETEKLIQGRKSPVSRNEKPIDPDVAILIRELSEKLGAKVDIVYGEKGNGKLIIHYNNNQELEGVIAHIH